jgi:hypothetical protein
MNVNEFNGIIRRQIQHSEQVLIQKAGEYATEDRLHNFKVAAALKGETPAQALAGMMAKHTVSVYDMLLSDAEFPPALWDEKIGDHINYLLLARAVVEEGTPFTPSDI